MLQALFQASMSERQAPLLQSPLSITTLSLLPGLLDLHALAPEDDEEAPPPSELLRPSPSLISSHIFEDLPSNSNRMRLSK
jgi:hypothetical protein